MFLAYGLGFIAVGSLLFLAGLQALRRPQPPGWLQQGVVGDLYTVALVALLVMGVGFLVKFAVQLPQQGFGLREAGYALAVLAAFEVGRRILRGRRSSRKAAPAFAAAPRASGEAASGATVVPLAPESGPAPGTPRPKGRPSGGRGARRKRAA